MVKSFFEEKKVDVERDRVGLRSVLHEPAPSHKRYPIKGGSHILINNSGQKIELDRLREEIRVVKVKLEEEERRAWQNNREK